MKKILVLNGPNLNLLGTREPHIYGSQGLSDIVHHLITLGEKLAINVDHFQSNAEHELIQKIHEAPQRNIELIIANFGAFTHTSIALRDAFLGVGIAFIEVHLSNVYAREPYRHHSYFSDKAIGIIAGFGPLSYELALQAAHHYFINRSQ